MMFRFVDSLLQVLFNQYRLLPSKPLQSPDFEGCTSKIIMYFDYGCISLCLPQPSTCFSRESHKHDLGDPVENVNT